jgi:hypothetical protein
MELVKVCRVCMKDREGEDLHKIFSPNEKIAEELFLICGVEVFLFY